MIQTLCKLFYTDLILNNQIIELNRNINELHVTYFLSFVCLIICLLVMHKLSKNEKVKFIVIITTVLLIVTSFILVVYLSYTWSDKLDALIAKQKQLSEFERQRILKIDKQRDSTYRHNLIGNKVIKKEIFKGEYYFALMTDSGKWKGIVPEDIFIIYDPGDKIKNVQFN